MCDRNWACVTPLVAVMVLLAGCGSSKTYPAASVQHAFRAAGIELSVLIDPQASRTIPGRENLDTIADNGPKILGVNGGTKDMSVLVFPRVRDAQAEQRSLNQFIAEVHAHPDRYRKYGNVKQIDDNGITRAANVLVLYRKSTPGLSRRITVAVSALH